MALTNPDHPVVPLTPPLLIYVPNLRKHPQHIQKSGMVVALLKWPHRVSLGQCTLDLGGNKSLGE